jgi:radical SAM protein with 4Fe4S-binding SPASM domain
VSILAAIMGGKFVIYQKIADRKFLVTLKNRYYLLITYPFCIYSIGDCAVYNKSDVVQTIHDFSIPDIDIDSYIRKVNSYFCLELLPSTRCNLACTGCIAQATGGNYDSLYSLDPYNDMSEETILFCIQKAIDKMEERLKDGQIDGDDISLDFFITGGEPFINGDNLLGTLVKGKQLFFELAKKYNKSAIYDPQIVTNGLLIQKRHIDKIKYLNVLITISFDTPINPNKLTKSGVSHRETAIEKFHMLIDSGHERVSANLCVEARHVDQLDAIMDYLDSKGIIKKASSIHMSPMSPPIHSSATVISSYKEDLNKTHIFSDKLIEYSKKYDIDMKLYRSRMLAQIINGGVLHRCCILNNKWCIFPSGDIYVCHMLGGIQDYHVGNIFDDNWQSTSKYKSLSEQFYNRLTLHVKPCCDCVLQTICINFIDCPARNSLENGDLNIVGKHQCEAAKSYLLYLLEDIILKEYNEND